jgi:hypothetical protein
VRNDNYLPCSYGCADEDCDACVPYGARPHERAEVIAWLRAAMDALDRRWTERRGRA